MKRMYRVCPEGRREGRKIICNTDNEPCPFVRFCQLEDQWLQNEEENCARLKELTDEKRRNAD